jgi:hypothetical protein
MAQAVTVAELETEPRPWTRADEHALILRSLPGARAAAWAAFQKLPPHSLELDELLGAARLGVVQAARAFPEYCARHGYDPHAGAGSYARTYVLRRAAGAVLDAQRTNDHASRSARGRDKALRDARPRLILESRRTRRARLRQRARGHPSR